MYFENVIEENLVCCYYFYGIFYCFVCGVVIGRWDVLKFGWFGDDKDMVMVCFWGVWI